MSHDLDAEIEVVELVESLVSLCSEKEHGEGSVASTTVLELL